MMLVANAATAPLAVLTVVLFASTPPARGSLQCHTANEFHIISKDVTDVCCDDRGEKCSKGTPAACDAGCAALLLPAFEACTAEGGFLVQPSMATALEVFSEAAAKCPTSDAAGAVAPAPKCATLADFHVIEKDTNHECCDEKTESCRNGIPAACNAGCAAVLVPAERACTAKDGLLEARNMGPTKAIFIKAAAMCRGGLPDPPCETLAEFDTINTDVTGECCDEKAELCRNGIPSTCNPGCAAILVPATRACTARGGYLESPKMSATKAVFVKAAERCSGASSTDPPCETADDYNAIDKYVTGECCDEKAELCRNGIPTVCNPGCAAILVPATKACTAKGGFLAQKSMRLIKSTLSEAAELCSPCHKINSRAHGTCKTSAASGVCHCICKPGYQGNHCDHATGCDHNPCGKHGKCSPNGAHYTCACTSGYNGVRCEIAPSPCHGVKCGAHGTCKAAGTKAVCHCKDRYTGSRCQRRPRRCCSKCSAGNDDYCCGYYYNIHNHSYYGRNCNNCRNCSNCCGYGNYCCTDGYGCDWKC